MASHALTKKSHPSRTQGISAVDYFSAKLNYELSPWVLNSLIENGTRDHVVLDVRSREQYEEGHIPGARNIPLDELISELKTLPKDKTIVTYCGGITCPLAPKAALELAQKGFKVKELYGGIAEWKKQGFLIDKP